MATKKQRVQGGQRVVWLASEYHPINFALMARVRGELTRDQCQTALDKLQYKHPALSVNVAQAADGHVYLSSNPALQLPMRIGTREHPERWVKEVTAELSRAFDLRHEPPLRCVLLQGPEVSDVLFVCPHALADGFSVTYLIRDLLGFLSNPEVDVTPMPLGRSKKINLPKTPCFLRGKHQVWEVFISGTT